MDDPGQLGLAPAPHDTLRLGQRRLLMAGGAAALVPALLVYTGDERLALAAAVVIGPFTLALWHQSREPTPAGTNTRRWVAAFLVTGLVLVFIEYWALAGARPIELVQLLGLATACTAAAATASLGGLVGRWLGGRSRARLEGRAARAGQPSATALAPEPPTEAGEECPSCGACYESATGRCRTDGTGLFALQVPLLLSGRYRLEWRLGRGGMATVYAALDTLLDRRVAIKLVGAHLGNLPGAVERFQREARAAAGFNHPNVVTVFDYGVSGSQAFLVMELLNGRTLRDALDREAPLPASRALPLLRELADAIEAAHDRRIVHRDLKPENVYLVPHGAGERAKVLDFGLARILTSAGEEPMGGAPDGAVLGTPMYMAPEQLRGEDANPSWDLWALAVIAFEMLHGVHPFAHVTEMPAYDASDTASELPAAVTAFFERALAIDPARRPPSASAVIAELTRSVHD